VEPFLVCENLVKIYKVAGLEVVALQGLNLSIQAGELMGIVGASGSGKSTLLNILGGLDRPSAGRLTSTAATCSKQQPVSSMSTAALRWALCGSRRRATWSPI